MSSRSGPQAVSFEQRADGRGSHPDAETPEFSLDPDTSPARVLFRQAKDQLTAPARASAGARWASFR